MKKQRIGITLLSLLLVTLFVCACLPVSAADKATTATASAKGNRSAANYVGYQTEKVDGGSFRIRFVAGLHGAGFSSVGFKISRITVSADGKSTESEQYYTGKTIYGALKADGGEVTADECGVRYLAIAEAEIPADANAVMIAVRPYIYAGDICRFGQAKVLYYTGEEEDGFPILKTREELDRSVRIPVFTYELNLTQYANIGYEPWGNAEMLVDEWFSGRKDEIYASADEKPFTLTKVDISKPSGAHTVPVDGCGTGNPPTPKFKTVYARTMDSLMQNSFVPATCEEESTYDEFGGISNSSIQGNATGFFHMETFGERDYIIDPLGNPFFVCGVNTINIGSTTNQKNYILSRFGTEEKYWIYITKALRDYGVNVVTGSTSSARDTETPLNGIVGVKGISSYMGSLGLATSTGGSSSFMYNNTMNVFDPDFFAFVDRENRQNLLNNRDNPYILGYTSDNELPTDTKMLENYLTLDPSVPINAFSYATAWTWLCAKTGKINPSVNDITADMREEFKAMVFGSLFYHVRQAIDKYDSNHMYIGTRANSGNKTSEGYLRAAGTYMDVLTINMYDGIEPAVSTMATIHKYSGKSFIVTEFYAKAQDAYDMNGQLLANQQNAGWLVRTQADRAVYYENYTLLLLESKYCVGWVWYRFQDNDQSLYYPSESDHSKILRVWEKGARYDVRSFIDEDGKILPATGKEVKFYEGEIDTSGLGSNKGIVDNKLNFFEPVMRSVDRVGKNIFKLIGYFDNLHA